MIFGRSKRQRRKKVFLLRNSAILCNCDLMRAGDESGRERRKQQCALQGEPERWREREKERLWREKRASEREASFFFLRLSRSSSPSLFASILPPLQAEAASQFLTRSGSFRLFLSRDRDSDRARPPLSTSSPAKATRRERQEGREPEKQKGPEAFECVPLRFTVFLLLRRALSLSRTLLQRSPAHHHGFVGPGRGRGGRADRGKGVDEEEGR